jgi:uncharacterized protein (TIGR02466 family)
MSKVAFSRMDAIFYSPILFFEIADCEALNRQILAETAAMRAESPGVSASNRGGWQSKKDFFARTEPGCVALRKHILEALRMTVLHLAPNFDFNAVQLHFDGWINVNPPGAFNGPHSHSGSNSRLSGTYYVYIPPNSAPQSGLFQFLDPRPYPSRIDGASCFEDKFNIRPRTGMLMIFPSYLYHWVYPNLGDIERVSVAFNMRYFSRAAMAAASDQRSEQESPLAIEVSG